MSDRFYSMIYQIGRWPIWLSGRPTLVGLEHTRYDGPYILASNHTSPYDVALLIYHVRRRLDFVSSTEVFRIPLLGWFYGAMNAFPLDRSRVDTATVRTILQRLARGRSIAMFPEGGFRFQDRSVLHGGRMRPGLGRLACLAQVPVLPCVIEDSIAYNKPTRWLPLRHCRYGLAFDEPMPPPGEGASDEDTGRFESDFAERLQSLHAGLLKQMGRAEADAATRRHRGWRN